MRSLAVAEPNWLDDAWMKAARKGPRPADGGGVFPRALSTATVQYNMRQVPQRGMAEMLQAYRTNPWLHTCIDIIGRKFGEVPWKLLARPDAQTGKRGRIGKYSRFKGEFRHKALTKALDTGELKEIENHPLLDLWEHPSPVMSGFCLRDLWCKYLKMQGECFTYKRRDVNGIVYELWVLPPTWIYRVPTENMPFFDVSVIGRTMRVNAEDMIWMKHPELLNPYTRGSGQGESLGAYIDTDHYAMEFQKAFFYNDARPNMLIHMANASKDTVEDFRNKLDNSHRGALRSHRPLIYDGPNPVDVTEIDVSKGMEAAIPLLKADRDTFLSVFGVPPEIAGVLASSNRATITVAETILARNVTAPQCEFILDEVDRQLVPEFDQGEGKILFSYDNPVPEDEDFQLSVLKAAPWTADMGEWRALAGLQSRGKKDEFYMVPINLSPTDDPSKPVIPLAPHTIGEVMRPGQTSTDVMGENGAPKPGSLKDPLSGVGNTQGGAGDDDEEEPPGGGSDDTAAGGSKSRLKKKSRFSEIEDYYVTLKEFDPAQPRDDQGEWSSGGGGAADSNGGGESVAPKPPADASKVKIASQPLNKEEKASLKRYQSYEYLDINGVARGQRTQASENYTDKEIAQYKQDVSNLDRSIKSNVVQENTTVYRGVHGLPKELTKQFDVGVKFTDSGFQSTSSSKEQAAHFATDGKNGILMHISVKAGQSALRINDHLKGRSNVSKHEQELLLGRGSIYKITNIVRTKGGKIKEIHVELQ